MKTIIPKYKARKGRIPVLMDIVEDDVRNRFVFTFVVICFFLFIVLSLLNSAPIVFYSLISNND